MLALNSLAAVTGEAKGPDLLAPLKVEIIGQSGQRTIDASTGPDGVAAYEFVQQVELVSVGQAHSVAAPALTESYEIAFHQGATANVKLPWTGMPVARFYYYPARTNIASHVRLRMEREGQAPVDTWLVASPGMDAMMARNLHGLIATSDGPSGGDSPATIRMIALLAFAAIFTLFGLALIASLRARLSRGWRRSGTVRAAVIAKRS
jgi:hypothetical protein